MTLVPPSSTSGSRPGFSPQRFGWFDVGMRDGAGTVARPPLFGGAGVDWIHPVRSQWQLHGGGGFTMPCLGVSMVKMHGVEGGGAGQVWPPLPVGADGGECWSSARPLVLRVNTEARCEPDLSVRPADYDPVSLHGGVLEPFRCGCAAAGPGVDRWASTCPCFRMPPTAGHAPVLRTS